jgi:hypothetical protein
MNLTEDQLRYALRESAEEIPASRIRPLRLPAGATARRRLPTLFAPVAAAAAVAAVIAISVTVAGHTAGPAGDRKSPLPGPPVSCTAPSSGCIPRYYLDLKGVIRDRITGATVATVQLPRSYRTIVTIAGSADDRSFVLAGQAKKGYSTPVRLFLARFNPATHGVTVSALPIPDIGPGPTFAAMALSPDGSELATAVTSGSFSSAVLNVYSLTGRVSGRPGKVWHGTGPIGSAVRNGLSWSSTGTLAIKSPTNGIRLLNTAAPGGSLLAHSRLAIGSYSTLGGSAFVITSGVLTPDGTKILAVLWRQDRATPVLEQEIEEYSAATGRPIRTLDRATGQVPYVYETLQWTNSSGTALVVSASPGPGKVPVFGVLSGGRFHPIPGAPAPSLQTLAF